MMIQPDLGRHEGSRFIQGQSNKNRDLSLSEILGTPKIPIEKYNMVGICWLQLHGPHFHHFP